jgi:MFS family permease
MMGGRRPRSSPDVVEQALNGRPRPAPLWIALASGYFAVGATLQVLPGQLEQQHSAGPALVAWTGSAPFLLSALARIWAGRISDRGWADVMVVDGAVLLLVGVLLQMSGGSVGIVVVARGVMGLGQGMMSAGALPWVVAAGPADRRGRTAARFGLSMWSGLAVGPLVASAISDWSSAARLAVIAASGGVSLVCATAGSSSRGTRVSLRGVARLRSPSRSRTVTPAGLYLGLMSYSYGSVIGLLVVFMDARGFASDGCLGVFAAGFLVARLGASPQIDGRGAGRVGAACAIVVACAFALLPIAPTTGVALALVATSGAGVGLAYPCAVTIAFTASSGSHARSVSTVTSWWDLGLVAGGAVSGLVVEQGGYDAAFAVAAVVAVVALLTIGVAKPTE